jgi:hypothetical protein
MASCKRPESYVWILSELPEPTSVRGQATKTGWSDGCGQNAVPLAPQSKYDFREPEAYLGINRPNENAGMPPTGDTGTPQEDGIDDHHFG